VTNPSLFPNATLVSVAWIASVLGSSAMVGPTLPEDQTKWRDTGFVQTQQLVGSRNPDIPMRSPIVDVNVYGVGKPGSNKPPWAKVHNLSEQIIVASEKCRPHRLLLPGNYPNVQLFSITIGTEPRRIPDLKSYARVATQLSHSSRVE
jgi:hypothetical protein